jgi:hypothetical protein
MTIDVHTRNSKVRGTVTRFLAKNKDEVQDNGH